MLVKTKENLLYNKIASSVLNNSKSLEFTLAENTFTKKDFINRKLKK
jgi:hypothetical protein